jgi:hypothetical protein
MPAVSPPVSPSSPGPTSASAPPPERGAVFHPGRGVEGIVDGLIKGGLCVMSVYAEVGIGLRDNNVTLVNALGQRAVSQPMPVCIGGDFNMSLDTLKSSGICHAIGCHILHSCPIIGTCTTFNADAAPTRSLIDFFVVSRSILQLARLHAASG